MMLALLSLYYICSVFSGIFYVIIMGPLRGNRLINLLGDLAFVLFMVPFVANPRFLYRYIKNVWRDL
jgi:hypothetical protein